MAKASNKLEAFLPFGHPFGGRRTNALSSQVQSHCSVEFARMEQDKIQRKRLRDSGKIV